MVGLTVLGHSVHFKHLDPGHFSFRRVPSNCLGCHSSTAILNQHLRERESFMAQVLMNSVPYTAEQAAEGLQLSDVTVKKGAASVNCVTVTGRMD